MPKLTFVTHDLQPDRVHAALLAVAAAWGGNGDLALDYEADGRSGAGAWTGERGDTRVASRITADASNPHEVVLQHHYTLTVGARTVEIRNQSLTTWLGQIDLVIDGATEAEVGAARDALIALLGEAAWRPPRAPAPAPAPAATGPLALGGVEMMMLLGTPERLRATLAFGMSDEVLTALATRLVDRDKGAMVDVLLEHGLPAELRARLAERARAFGYAALAERLGAGPPDAVTFLTACEREPIAVLTAMLDAGADVEAEATPTSRSGADFWRGIRRDGWTPLMVALHNDRLDLLELLLARGADPNRKTASYRLPLDVARTRKHHLLVAPLEAAGARAWTDADQNLPSAVWRSRDDLAERLLADASPAERAEAFVRAARTGKARWVTALLPEDPAQIHAALRAGVIEGATGAVRTLAEAGDVRSHAAELLALAVDHDRGGSLRALHRAGADPFAPLDDGRTPLDRAITDRRMDAIATLHDLGAQGPDLSTVRSTAIRRKLGEIGVKTGRRAEAARASLEERFGPLTRPAWRLQLVRLGAETPAGAHRFGGPVPLVEGEAHPSCPCGAPLDLLVQLRLDELPEPAGAGWVQVLVCQSPEHLSAPPPGQTWGVLPHTVRTRRLPAGSALTLSETAPRIAGWTLRGLRARVPDWPQAKGALPESATEQDHAALRQFGVHLPGDKLGGHCTGSASRSRPCAVCEAPTVLLAQLGHSVAQWSWAGGAHLALRQCTADPAHLQSTLHGPQGWDATRAHDWTTWMDARREAKDPRWQLLYDPSPKAAESISTLYPAELLGPLDTTALDWELVWTNAHWDGLTLRDASALDAAALLTEALAHPSARLLHRLELRLDAS